MADRPYILLLQTALAASGAGTLQYPVPPGEKLSLSDFRFIATGAFSITDIRDSSGKHFTNASPATPILSTMIQNAASPNLGLTDFDIPLLIDGNTTFYVDLLDTSAAPNTVRLVFTGIRNS